MIFKLICSLPFFLSLSSLSLLHLQSIFLSKTIVQQRLAPFTCRAGFTSSKSALCNLEQGGVGWYGGGSAP